jgi:hypothetical protein
MSIRIRSVSVLAALAFALTSLPVTGQAFPLSAPADSAPQLTVQDTNPLRSLLDLLALESASLWTALDSLYSDAYVETTCDLPC